VFADQGRKHQATEAVEGSRDANRQAHREAEPDSQRSAPQAAPHAHRHRHLRIHREQQESLAEQGRESRGDRTEDAEDPGIRGGGAENRREQQLVHLFESVGALGQQQHGDAGREQEDPARDGLGALAARLAAARGQQCRGDRRRHRQRGRDGLRAQPTESAGGGELKTPTSDSVNAIAHPVR
jgi:hypothetical protein